MVSQFLYESMTLPYPWWWSCFDNWIHRC